jgi:hypothetical protein
MYDFERDSRAEIIKQADEDSQSMKHQVMDSIRDSAGRSSVHAFPSLATKGIHPIIVAIWIVCMTASWGYLIYQIYNTVVLYNTLGVTTSIGVAFEVPTDFPGKSLNSCFTF